MRNTSDRSRTDLRFGPWKTVRFFFLLIACLSVTVTPVDRAGAEDLRGVEYPAKPAEDWTALLMNRNDGWTGADGIFTANLDGTIIGGTEARTEQRTVFVFSDTLVGKVDHQTKTRSDVKMYNHSFAVLRGNEPRPEKIEFFHPENTPGLPIKPSKEDQWYWLSECFVLPGKEFPVLHAFLLRIEKATGGGAFGFRHIGVDLLRVPVHGDRLDFAAAVVTEDDAAERKIAVFEDKNGERKENEPPISIAFGIGVLENIESAGAIEPDGYLYVYGYRDAGPWSRQLVAAKVLPEEVAKFDRWKYYAGNGRWNDRLTDAVGLADGVSTELSVTPVVSKTGTCKYVLIYTPGTIGSKIAFRIGDTPVGPFGEERILYEEPETRRLGQGVFTYNAKAHPVLSKSGELLISYNVNSNDDSFRIFREADIYCPRFVKVGLDDLWPPTD